MGCGGRWLGHVCNRRPGDGDFAKSIGDEPGHRTIYPRDHHRTFAQLAIRIDREWFPKIRRAHTCNLIVGRRGENRSYCGVVLVMRWKGREFCDAEGL
jgi:hypothetical protein